MKIKKLHFLCLSMLLFAIVQPLQAKDKKEKKEVEEWKFETIKELKSTPVKAQNRTGTCWDFATTSFLESELLRMGKGEFNLSEMYTVRHTYPKKAERFVRLHGMFNFSQGGQAHDVLNIIREFGCVPEEAYPGLELGYDIHNHGELMAVMNAYMKAVIQKRSGKITPVWKKGLEGILDAYLGDDPKSFDYKGKEYTPKSFADELGINPDDYVELTSYTFYPMWEKCLLEIPDNWTLDGFYNVPLDTFMEIMYGAIESGYTVVWDGDVSDDYFSSRTAGVGFVPEVEFDSKDGDIKDYIKQYHKNRPIDAAERDEAFIDQSTTDDHLMHLVGIAKDQGGDKYFLTKNSGGTERANKGFVYMSDSYVRLRTTAIMVHKDAIPEEIAKKLGIK